MSQSSHERRLQTVARAIELAEELLPSERYPNRDPVDSLEIYSQDFDFLTDVRNLLAEMADPEFDIRQFLLEAESNRSLDLLRAQDFIGCMSRDQLTGLLIQHSLCPLHRCDWAICFDDEDPSCDAIRQIYPNSHDT